MGRLMLNYSHLREKKDLSVQKGLFKTKLIKQKFLCQCIEELGMVLILDVSSLFLAFAYKGILLFGMNTLHMFFHSIGGNA